LYEGEFLNDKRHGKGKLYNDGKIKYDGEYLNGKKHGNGKLYLKNELIFEGEFKDDKRWNGKGKEYEYEELEDVDNELIFEGEYVNGEKIKKI